MPFAYTPQQIIALAPDGSGARAAQDVAQIRKWNALGADEFALWGECQGSGKSPYQTGVSAAGPAFKCSCPSRKFPCKHGLGLLLLHAASPFAFKNVEQPEWVSRWLAEQLQRAIAAPLKTPTTGVAIEVPAESPKASQREERVAAGLSDLRRWLRDLARQGLADVQSRGFAAFEEIASRMVDAQTPGAARILRDMAQMPSTGAGWEPHLLFRLSQLHLLVEAFDNRRSLTEDVLSDVKTALGWPVDKLEAARLGIVRGSWLLAGQRVIEEDRLRAQRCWLHNAASGRSALYLQFAHGRTPFDLNLTVGVTYSVDMAFFRSAFSLRAFFVEPPSITSDPTPRPQGATVNELFVAYSTAIAASPWIERLPLFLDEVWLVMSGTGWLLRDSLFQTLPVAPSFDGIWRLAARAGGHPVALFGEWDGVFMWPLSMEVNGRFVEP